MMETRLLVLQLEGDTFMLHLTEDRTPAAFERRVADLMRGGLPEAEARHAVTATPICMELFCDPERGLFAVESEPLAHIRIFNPYSGEEVPDEILDE
ncbi:hypothetical protein [Alistipes putredinis]|uniref:hypothetical protein n=1 Tax=Alistipes putredinis TaxID=28117 RepID=UPI003AB20315